MVTDLDGNPPRLCPECNRITVRDRAGEYDWLHWSTGLPECGSATEILAHLEPWGVYKGA